MVLFFLYIRRHGMFDIFLFVYSMNAIRLGRSLVFRRLAVGSSFSLRNASRLEPRQSWCRSQLLSASRRRGLYLEQSVCGARFYCSSRDSDDGHPANEGGDGDQPPNYDPPTAIHALPATQTVPEVWPIVPVIAINRNPVFPRFIKILEAS
jgi:hypothetical protein